jgi:hypothetical protein
MGGTYPGRRAEAVGRAANALAARERFPSVPESPLRILVFVSSLLILACAGPRSWYDQPDWQNGTAYKNCFGEVESDGQLVSDYTFNNKGSIERSRDYNETGDFLNVISYTYAPNGTTLVQREYGPSESEVTETTTYEYEAGELVKTEARGGGDAYTTEITYGEGGRREEESFSSTADDYTDYTLSWDWSERNDGDVADITSDKDGDTWTKEWDADHFLVTERISNSDLTYTIDYGYTDDKKPLLKSYVVDFPGENDFTQNYTYDDDGRIEKLIDLVVVGEFESRTELRYDWACD